MKITACNNRKKVMKGLSVACLVTGVAVSAAVSGTAAEWIRHAKKAVQKILIKKKL